MAVASALLIVGSLAQAQVADQQYEIIELPPLAVSGTMRSTAFEINNRHDIVGWSRFSGGTDHAVIWLTCDGYAQHGFTAGGPFDLTALAGLTTNGNAYGINDDGVVVGTQFSPADGFDRGFVWDLRSSGLYTQLGVLNSTGSGSSRAWDITNGATPWIVGDATSDAFCELFPGTQVFVSRAFRVAFDASASSWPLTEIGNAPAGTIGDVRSARAASLATAGGSLLAAGATDIQCQMQDCEGEINAVRMDGPGSELALPDSGASFGSFVSASVPSERLAGYAIVEEDIPPILDVCVRRAALWERANGAYAPFVDLGDEWDPFRNTVANGMTEARAGGVIDIVGTDEDVAEALRWHRDASGTWTAQRLADQVVLGNAAWDRLLEATDVSDFGWIVGNGVLAGGGTRGFLLKPIAPGDTNGDCEVDGADITNVLAFFNQPQPQTRPWCDFDGDGVVSGSDLTIVLAEFGTVDNCFECAGTPIGGSPGRVAGEIALGAGLDVMGFSCLSSYRAWCGEASSAQVDAMSEILGLIMQEVIE